jgi:hypothetical protein
MACIQLLDPTMKLTLSLDYNIFVHDLSHHFRSKILLSLTLSPQGSFLSQFQGFVEVILHSIQVTVVSTFVPAFFMTSFLTSFYSVDLWMVSSHIPSASVLPHTFHIYWLFTRISAHSSALALTLPAHGLTLLDAKHLGILTYYLFGMINLLDSLQVLQQYDLSFQNRWYRHVLVSIVSGHHHYQLPIVSLQLH